jgi:hypothetical protein
MAKSGDGDNQTDCEARLNMAANVECIPKEHSFKKKCLFLMRRWA